VASVIKNKKDLPDNVKDTIQIIDAGLEAATPAKFLSRFITKDMLKTDGKFVPLSSHGGTYIVAVGKAADSMTRFACERISISGGIVVVPKYYSQKIGQDLTLIRSSHPVPTQSSVRAARSIISFLNERKKNDLILFFVSGGASSLVSLPSLITLKQKQTLNRILLQCGATIGELNALRKHFSQIKGGRILNSLQCPAVSFVMSDVVGDDLSVIGSGLTFCDKSTFSDCLKIIKKYRLQGKVPKQVLWAVAQGAKGKIQETPKKPKIQNVIVATNSDCLVVMASKARSLGYATKIMPQLQGDVGLVAKKILKNHSFRKKSCLVFGGEPTVLVRGSGKGGRNQELVLRLVSQSSKPLIAASVGTDGIDGNTKYAGAVFSGPLAKNTAQSYLTKNDSSAFFKKHGGLILTGPTHTNLMDVGVVITE